MIKGSVLQDGKQPKIKQASMGQNGETNIFRKSISQQSFEKLFRGERVRQGEFGENDPAIILSNGRALAGSKVIRKIDIPGEIQIFQVTSPVFFREALKLAQKTSSHGAFVALRDIEEYKNAKLFLSTDGATGIAIANDGHIFSLFKNCDLCDKLGVKNVAAKMMFTAIANGGNKLDCFNGFLTNLYTTFGFEPVVKIKFSEDLVAGVSWNYKRDGEPDLIFMKHNGHSIDKIIDNMGFYKKFSAYKVSYAKDFHQAEKILDDVVKNGKKNNISLRLLA